MKDVVTAVEAQKKGAFVTVNETERLWFSRDAWLERSYEAGESVDLDELKKWLLPRQYTEALNAAVRLLAVRSRSVREVRDRLVERGYMDDTIEMALYKLEKNDLLNDERFAEEWARERSHRQLGKRRIIMELREKGVASDTAERAVSALDEEDCESAGVALAEKLLRRYDGYEPREAMNKIMAAMARRGYGFDESRSAVEEALRRAEE